MNLEIPKVDWTKDRIYKAFLYCEEIYEYCLPVVVRFMEHYHNTAFSERYVKILVGDWLYKFIHVMYDRYLSVSSLDGKSMKLILKDFNKNHFHFIPPLDYRDFSEKIALSDKYNSIIYYVILLYLLNKNLFKDLLNFSSEQVVYQKKASVKKRVWNVFCKLIARPEITSLMVTAPYICSIKDRIKIAIMLRKFAVFNDFTESILIEYKIDVGKRTDYKVESTGHEFTDLLQYLIPLYFPSLFLEGLESVKKKITLQYFPKVKVCFTANALISGNSVFKLFLAENNEQIKILNHQHGGGYGMHIVDWKENYETSISDKFYTWGWSQDNKDYEYLPPPFFIKRKSMLKKNKNLLTLSILPRYLDCLQFFPEGERNQVCIDNTISFLKNLLNLNLTIKTYPNDYGWGIRRQIENNKIKFPFYKGKKSARELMPHFSLIIHNYLSTSFLESLAANIPTVCFYDSMVYEFRDSFKTFSDSFLKLGIFHENPINAAYHVNSVQSNVSDWWNQHELQETVNEFVYTYIRQSVNWIDVWKNELIKSIKN